MANLSIRKLDDEVYDRLRDRAKRKGTSIQIASIARANGCAIVTRNVTPC